MNKLPLLLLAALLAGCGKDGPSHAQLLEKGCVFQERRLLPRMCGKGGCWTPKETVYACPAYEVGIPD